MPNIVNYNKMNVSGKGGGKHWTKTEVEKRKAAAQAFQRNNIAELQMPEWLNDEAQKVWNKVIKDMSEFEILDNVDADSLAVYCDAVAKYQELTTKVRENGYITINAQGTETVSPYVRASQGYARIMMQYADKLGLNANARARLAKKKADTVDESKSMFGD